MRVDIVSLFPDMFDALAEYGITGRAIRNKLLSVGLWNPRDFTHDKHRTVDDRPFGGGPGMLMKLQPLQDAIAAAKDAQGDLSGKRRVIYLSPQGRRLDQAGLTQLVSTYSNIILVAGRYEGIDERLIETEIDEEISIGDYVLSGGELAAMVMMDAMTRLIPGAVGNGESVLQDSFSDGLLECAHYTRPELVNGLSVPPVLMSGHHQAIQAWRKKNALGRTWLKRPDLLEDKQLDEEQSAMLDEFIQEYQLD